MKKQQVTEELIQATTDRLAPVLARRDKPMQDAGWLMCLPKDDVIRHTTALVKNLSSGWQSRIGDLNKKMLSWMEAKHSEGAATENLSALRQRQSETELAGQENRVRFRELLSQNGGTVTQEMKALRAEYLEQQEMAKELAELITEKEKQLPALANETGRKAKAYVYCHEGITDDRIDELLDDFFILHGVELSSLLRMKYSQFERDGSAYTPGVIEGTNDADTLYRGFILSLMLKWTHIKLPLMFRDDVMSLTGASPVSGAIADRRKYKPF